jgi:hypothetical protein
VNDVVEIEMLQFGVILFFQQRAEVIDDFRRSLVVPAYAGQYLLDPLNVGRVGFQIERRSLGIALNGSQRLAQFMGHGGGQCARDGRTVQMDDFQQPLTQFRLRDSTPAPFEKTAT